MKPADIRKTLDRYIEWREPDYAIMLFGDWGTGKTYFIKDYIETRVRAPHRKKIIYLSLYGVRSETEIDSQILIHKVSSKLMIATGLLILLLLCGAMYCWLEKTESVVNILFHGFGVLALSFLLWHYRTFKEKDIEHILCKNDLIVFDDFERAEMLHEQLLAYINRFVEHLNKHVVIVCNKDEIKDDLDRSTDSISREEQDSSSAQDNEQKSNLTSCSQFLKKKEKVIGKEIFLEQDSKTVLSHLWEDGDFPILKKTVNDGRLGFDWFISVTTPQAIPVNYRVWKRCCRDYETTFFGIEESIICHPVVSQQLIPFFFPVCYGIQIHDFGDNHLFPNKSFHDLYCLFFAQKQPLKWFFAIFPNYSPAYSNILNNLWNEIFYQSEIDTDGIKKYLKAIVEREDSFLPKLRYYHQQDDLTTDNAWQELKNAYRNRSITDPNDIADIVYSVIDMISNHCCPDSILTTRKVAALTRLYCKRLSLSVENETSFSASNLSIFNADRIRESGDEKIAKGILAYLENKVQSQIQNILIPGRFRCLLSSLQTIEDFNKCWYEKRLRIENVFSNQEPKLLVDALLKFPVQSLHKIIFPILSNLTDVPFSSKPFHAYAQFKRGLINSLKDTLNNSDFHLQRAQKFYFEIAVNNLSNSLKEFDEREKTSYLPTSTDKEPEK